MSVFKGWDAIETALERTGSVDYANDKGNPILLTGEDAERWEESREPFNSHEGRCIDCCETLWLDKNGYCQACLARSERKRGKP